MKTTALAAIALTTFLSLNLASICEARGYHGRGGGSRGHSGHGNHEYPTRFYGRIYYRWPSEEERLRTSPAVVTAVQQSLRHQGFYRGPITGQLNPETKRAISRFQGSDGIRNTGTIDPILVNALGLKFDPRQ